MCATAPATRYVKTAKPSGSSRPPSAPSPDSCSNASSSVVGRQAALAQQVEQRAGIDRSGARRHRDALERAEPHRRIDRGAVQNGRDRAAATEVARDDPRGIQLLDDRLHGDPVESVASDPPLRAPALRNRVGRRRLGDGGVERSVEDGDVRDVGESCLCLADRAQRRLVVKGRQSAELLDRGNHLVVDAAPAARSVLRHGRRDGRPHPPRRSRPPVGLLRRRGAASGSSSRR